MEIQRNLYLKELVAGEGNGLIKIVTGVRRCGKSYLLFKIFYDYLTSKGVREDHIIRIDLEDLRNEKLRYPISLVQYIDSHIKDKKMYYILLDEVQYVPHFEEVLNSYLKVENVDVYVTGSNSKFLSSDIVTEFRGRGDEIRVYPLSYFEIYNSLGGDKMEVWRDYFTYGGLPHILQLQSDQKKIQYLKNLYKTVYKADLEERNKIFKAKEMDDLVKIIASSIGAPVNPTRISNSFKTLSNSTLAPYTISQYLSYLEDAFLVEKSQRYDVKGRKYINSLSKFYFVDLGLRNALLDFRQQEETHIIENIIYNELRRRGFSVDVGVVETKTKKDSEWIRKQLEVDFVANLGSKRYYIQSALSMPNKEKIEQESASLLQIRDNFKKIIIVRDYVNPWYSEEGIMIVNLFDFLLDENVLNL